MYMGEYIKYRHEIIKIGTCENLYYTSYPKYCTALESNRLSREDGNLSPELYAKPDSGFRFRFPFPDEDKLPTVLRQEIEKRRGGNVFRMLMHSPNPGPASNLSRSSLWPAC